jgi:hypothetical protein
VVFGPLSTAVLMSVEVFCPGLILKTNSVFSFLEVIVGKGSKSGSSSTYRSAETGKYVTKATAVRNPKTTVKETNKK